MIMRRWNGDGAPFGGNGLGAQMRSALAQPPTPTGAAAAALEKVRGAQQALRGVERSLRNLEEVIGPEAALQAYEQAQQSLQAAWLEYAEAAQEIS